MPQLGIRLTDRWPERLDPYSSPFPKTPLVFPWTLAVWLISLLDQYWLSCYNCNVIDWLRVGLCTAIVRRVDCSSTHRVPTVWCCCVNHPWQRAWVTTHSGKIPLSLRSFLNKPFLSLTLCVPWNSFFHIWGIQTLHIGHFAGQKLHLFHITVVQPLF